MKSAAWRAGLGASALLALGAAAALIAAVGEAEAPPEGGRSASAPERAAPRVEPARPATVPAAWLAGFDPRVREERDGRSVAGLRGGRVAELTVDAELEAHVRTLLARYEVPFGAVVAIEPSTGRVLAYVSHSSAAGDGVDLALDPTPPAASVFKVVTAAALLDDGVAPDADVCYGGGLSRLTLADLEDDPSRDRWCATLSEALGGSVNAVFAKLADRRLDRETLERYAAAFGFGHSLPFDVATVPSPAEVPTDRLERARTAAGFWHMHLSPFHAAVIAATIAADGTMMRPTLIRRVTDAGGRVVFEHEPRTFRSVIPRATARRLGTMMERTVSDGTARRAFFDERGQPFLPGVRVAGKTGTLTGASPYRAYTWWVGFAPADHPRIAVAVLVVNTPRWRIKASYLAREALREYLVAR